MTSDRPGLLSLEVSRVEAEARDVVVLELRAPDGAALPPFEPGAHVEVHLAGGLVRHYSLTNDSRERDRYVLGVGLAPGGRGGSGFLHQMVRKGHPLRVTAPRNNFRLDPAAQSFLFLAGGIGVTPLVSMVRWCEANGRAWRLVYAARNGQRAAFYETLRPYGERVRFHFDDQEGAVLDVGAVMASVAAGEHVYCCGPAPMIVAVQAHSERLSAAQLHFEYFSAPADSGVASATEVVEAGAFTVTLRRSGGSFTVPPEKSVLEVLEAQGMQIPYSCREGFCRTCETTVCAGEVEHRDYVLSEAERAAGTSMMLCVSRARSAVIELDL